MDRRRQLVILVLLIAGAGLGVRALFQYGGLRWQQPQQPTPLSSIGDSSENYSWAAAVEKVKEARREAAAVAIETPLELRHYSDRHWFLATQVAEVERFSINTCQDFVDLSAMIQRGELVGVPAVTKTFVLYGVGEKADDEPFSRHQDENSIELYDEARLANTYRVLGEKRSNLKQTEQKQINAPQQERNSIDEAEAQLDRFYGNPNSRQRLFRDYATLQTLARNFAGRSFDLDKPADRWTLKVSMLSSLRPEALKILEEVAAAYHRRFDRPLPISSLVRPEQYQRALRRVNRNAVLIDTPPHSTGLAFDIDYRYMSAAEQNFLMAELARLKRAGRIEAIRERSANYHVFAFVNGMRPGDELIAASLDEAMAEVREEHHAWKQSQAVRKQKSGRNR